MTQIILDFVLGLLVGKVGGLVVGGHAGLVVGGEVFYLHCHHNPLFPPNLPHFFHNQMGKGVAKDTTLPKVILPYQIRSTSFLV